MKKYNFSVVLIVLVLLLFCRHFAFGQWELLNPKPTTMSLRKVSFVNKNVGYVGGYRGFIMKTTDGGISWEKEKVPIDESIEALHFVNEDIGFALSYIFHYSMNGDSWDSFLYKTTDGGKQWSQLSIFYGEQYEYKNLFTLMNVIDEDTIYLSGRYNIIKTTDKGVTWNEVPFIKSNFWNSDMFFLDNKHFYFYGLHYNTEDTVYFYEHYFCSTKDYGKNWSFTKLKATDYFDNLNSIFFNDTIIGYAVGNKGQIFKTTDGGNNWIKINSNTASDLTSVWFIDSITGFITCSDGRILKTLDQGQSWNSMDTGIEHSINDICFVDKDYGIFIGDIGSILKTTDAGKTIDKINISFTNKNLYSLSFINPETGYVCGANGTVMKTKDGGKNWDNMNIDTSIVLSYVYFSDENNGLVYGWKNADNKNVFYTTASGGKQWKQIDFDTIHVNSVSFVNSRTGYAAGKDGIILKTTDGGGSWQKLHFDFGSNFDNLITDITFRDESFGYALGSFITKKSNKEGPDVVMKVILTTDSARTWKIIDVPYDSFSYNYVKAYCFIDSLTGFVTIEGHDHSPHSDIYSNSVNIYKTKDGGKNWKSVYWNIAFYKSLSNLSNTALTIKSINFIDENRGYAIGYSIDEGELILETTDQGETWQGISNGIASALYSMTYIKPGVGYAVGYYGTILKFGDSVNTNVCNVRSIDDKVKVYPNPADKIIKLSGLGDASAYVEIYNLTGMKVQYQRMTNNSINITRLSDGMYIVKIINKENITAKKLIVKHSHY